jgi:pyruvate kinase
VATIGPASSEHGVLVELLRAGVDVVRLNLSHGPLEDHLRRLAAVRAAADEVQRPIAVLADLPGPKIRAGGFPAGGVDLVPGRRLRLVPGDGPSSADVATVAYETLCADLQVDDRVVFGDGAITLGVVAVSEDGVDTVVLTGGRANGRPGVHLSSERLRLTTPTAEDLVLAAAVAAAGVEYVAVSFVRRGADVDAVRTVVGDRALLVAKIETRAALDDFEAVLAASDAVMVARGDLGIDCPIEDVPHLQKAIVRRCVETGVPVITATQMLESMTVGPSPTRAEVSDVANAVFDGTDALMLSGETAIGVDPVEVVRTMSRIAARAEAEASYRRWAERLGRAGARTDWRGDVVTAAVTHAAWQAAHDTGAAAILCCTRSGRTARSMARFRPEARLIGLSPNESTLRSLSLSWGVEPLSVDTYASTDELVWFAVERAVERGFVQAGDIVLVLAGAPDRPSDAATDVMRVVTVA